MNWALDLGLAHRGSECERTSDVKEVGFVEKQAGEEQCESNVSPYLKNLRRYGGRDEELVEARKQVLKMEKRLREARKKEGLEG